MSVRAAETPPPYGLTREASGRFTFAIPVSPKATAVEFCVFDELGTESRVSLSDELGSTWWGQVDVSHADRYGIRVTGPGLDASKLLIDPWSHAIDGSVRWLANPAALRLGSGIDSAPLVPRSVVVDNGFDWGASRRPFTSWSNTVIYEMHVRGATLTHPEIDPQLRGTYAGVAHPAFIEHLRHIGVTAVELLPIHHHVSEERLAHLGLSNYWGYNSLGFLAPHQDYGSARRAHGDGSGLSREQRVDHVAECKGMIKLLHEAGIEVILDVVYNHTCEAGVGGAAISMRGLDPDGWYRTYDVTGCGNTLDTNRPHALSLVMDSLRNWVTEYQVDGFRFDLAPALARTPGGDFAQQSAFLMAVATDPVLSSVKLIAEPWDVGAGGYQVGGFPSPWAEWNDRYRDVVRDHWRGHASLGAFAARLSSSDIFAGSRRRPWSSVNFITSHDGFTLQDLASYNDRHNEANGEGGRDGNADNRSNNHGVEGPTDDAHFVAARRNTVRAMLATLFFSQGTPMLLGGDEFGRTQRGNNNAYCQDSDISWFDWSSIDRDLIDFVRALTTIRQEYPVLRRGRWLGPDDVTWLAPDGTVMSQSRWEDPAASGLMVVLHGDTGEQLVIVYNNGPEQSFVLPEGSWTLKFSSTAGALPACGSSAGLLTAPLPAPFPAQSVSLAVRC